MTNTTLVRLLAGTAAAALLAAGASAATPKNALGAIAASPDGAMLAAAGDNRVLYLLDPATLDVKARVPIATNPLEMAFSKDSSTLAILTTDGELRFHRTADWSLASTVKDIEAAAFAMGSDQVVAMSRPGWGDDPTTPLAVYPLNGGAPVLQVTVKGKMKSVAVAPDATQLVLLSEQADEASEPKAQPDQSLQGLARTEFEQKNDGKASELVLLDKTGAETARAKTFFGSYETFTGAVTGGHAYFIGYGNDNAKVNLSDLSVTLFELKASYNYGIGISADQTKAAGGSLRDGTVADLAAGTSAEFKLDDQDGWPEYFEGFAFGPDGSVYGGTTAYRLAKISPSGQILLTKPIY
jgi:hypothetical protein